jgi:hypothetical protein
MLAIAGSGGKHVGWARAVQLLSRAISGIRNCLVIGRGVVNSQIARVFRREYLAGYSASVLINEARVNIAAAFVLHGLSRLGVTLDTWPSAVLDVRLRMLHQQRLNGQTPNWQPVQPAVGLLTEKLLKAITLVCLYLCEGEQHHSYEQALIALVHDQFSADWRYTHTRDVLQNSMLCAAIDGGLRRIGNVSGFDLTGSVA